MIEDCCGDNCYEGGVGLECEVQRLRARVAELEAGLHAAKREYDQHMLDDDYEPYPLLYSLAAQISALLPASPTDQKEVMPNIRHAVQSETTSDAGRHDNATPRPAHSPAGAEPWTIHSYLPGEFAIARPGPENYARHTIVNAHCRADAELIVNALNTYEGAPPQVTDEMVERAEAVYRHAFETVKTPNSYSEMFALATEAMRAALTAALGK